MPFVRVAKQQMPFVWIAFLPIANCKSCLFTDCQMTADTQKCGSIEVFFFFFFFFWGKIQNNQETTTLLSLGLTIRTGNLTTWKSGRSLESLDFSSSSSQSAKVAKEAKENTRKISDFIGRQLKVKWRQISSCLLKVFHLSDTPWLVSGLVNI